MKFRKWLEMDLRAWDDTRNFGTKSGILRRDPRFANLDDDQLEHLFQYLTPEEAIELGPQEAFERCLDAANMAELDVGDIT